MSNIKYKILNLDSIFDGVRAIYKEAIQQRNELENIAEFARDRIVAETRKGNDLTGNAGAKQPPLSPGYVAYRRRVQKGKGKGWGGGPLPKPDLQFFSPKRSNLTLTGELLNSIDYKVSVSSKSIIIEPTGVRSDGSTNKEVAKDLANKGRYFLGLDERGFQRMRKVIIEAIRRVALKKGY